MTGDYVVGLTADGADSTGYTIFGDIGLERLTEAGLSWRLLPQIPVHGPVDPADLEEPALAWVRAVLAEATLAEPQVAPAVSAGRDGRHTEALGYLLAEMQHLARSHPGASW